MERKPFTIIKVVRNVGFISNRRSILSIPLNDKK